MKGLGLKALLEEWLTVPGWHRKDGRAAAEGEVEATDAGPELHLAPHDAAVATNEIDPSAEDEVFVPQSTVPRADGWTPQYTARAARLAARSLPTFRKARTSFKFASTAGEWRAGLRTGAGLSTKERFHSKVTRQQTRPKHPPGLASLARPAGRPAGEPEARDIA